MQACAAFLCGILLEHRKSIWWLLPFLFLLFYVLALSKRAGCLRQGVVRLLLLTAIGIGGILHTACAESLERPVWELAETETDVLIKGRIYKKETKNQNQIYYLDHSVIQHQSNIFPNHRILLYLEEDPCRIGDVVLVQAHTRPMTSPANEGNFDQKCYYHAHRIDMICCGDSIKLVSAGGLPVQDWLFRLREGLKRTFLNHMDESKAGVLSTMVLGDRTVLDPDIKEMYRSAGISHILAISGLHISLIGAALLKFLRRCGLGVVPAGLVSGGVILLYTCMTGASPSAIRACTMFLYLLVSLALRRSYDLLTALSVAAMIELLANPFLTDDSGFVFSFCAVLSVAICGKVLTSTEPDSSVIMLLLSGAPVTKSGGEERDLADAEHPLQKNLSMKRWGEKLKEKTRTFFKQTLPVSIALQLVTVPMVMWNYYEIPVYALLINFLVLPFVGVVLLSGIVGSAFGLLGLFWPAHGAFFVAGTILTVYEWICTAASKLPGAGLITGKPAVWMMVLYYAVLAAVLLLIAARRDRRYAVIPMLLLGVLAFCPKRTGFELSMLDVGQGDGIYLALQGQNVFIDGGSSDVKQVGKYRIEPFLKSKGCRSVDYWFVSHTDEDHVSGLKELLNDDYKIENIILSKHIYRDESVEELWALAKEKGTKVLSMSAGEELHCGDSSFLCLFPDRDDIASDRNGQSMVLLLTRPSFSALFTGDISEKEEAVLMRQPLFQEAVSGLTFYKAAHHGSGGSNGAAYLQALSPKMAGISCAMKNRYGHPAKEAVAHMEDTGAKVFETRFLGQIKVTMEKGRALVVSMKEPPGQITR